MQGLISNLIRPFRFRYSIFDLGPRWTDKYDREDSSILNDRGFRIQYSYYKNKCPSDTCLIYAHCNSGCRVQGLQFVQQTMDYGWNLCLFDFAGSGISEGDYISLGFFQCIDLQVIVSMTLKEGNSKINLWGRSMGAATIIQYLSQTKQIDAIMSCVLDSPYCSLWRVVKQFGKSKTKIPQFIVEHVMEYLRKSIIKDYQFDIKQMQLLKKIHKIQLPIMFIASTSDSFVNCNHAAELYKWAGSKQKVLQYIDKQHNSPRQHNTVGIGLAFMSKSLIEKQQSKKQLRILSKKKQFCRKMTGNNMAQLITKPLNKTKKTQSISTGNLARFSSFCLNGTSNKDINSQKIQTFNNQNRSKPKNRQSSKQQRHDSNSINTNTNTNRNGVSSTNGSNTKNPHKIEQSIIKLSLPKQIKQHMKNINMGQNEEQRMNATQPGVDFKNNKILYKQKSKQKQNRNFDFNFHLDLDCNFQVQNANANQGQSSGSMHQVSNDKENNLNISNKSEDQQKIMKINSEIKNFSSIITKRFHFDNNQVNLYQHIPKIKLLEKEQLKDKKSKTQKIGKLYVKQDLNKQSLSRSKPNGIKIFNKIHKHHIQTKDNTFQKRQNNRIIDECLNKNGQNIKRGKKCTRQKIQRVKTQIVQTRKQQQSQSDYDEQPNDKQNQRKIKPIHLYSSFSQKSTDERHSQTHLQLKQNNRNNKWLCGQNPCKVADCQDFITSQIFHNKYGDYEYQKGSRQKHAQLSYNQLWNQTNYQDIEPLSQKLKLQLKHFQSIGDLPSSTDCGDEIQRINEGRKIVNANCMNKTQKIIKIQLDRSMLKGQQKQVSSQNIKMPIKNKKQQQRIPQISNNINLISNANINLNQMRKDNKLQQNSHSQNGIQIKAPVLQINPALSKFKLKHKKLLKIRCDENNNNSFL